MPALIDIQILRDTASPAARDLLANLKNPAPVLKHGAGSAAKLLRTWFRDRNGEPNKQGWPSRGLWAEIASATAVQSSSDAEAVISIAHPAILQKVYGGPIEPKRGRFLAIAASASAYAAGSPREGAHPELKMMMAPVPEGGRWPGDKLSNKWAWALVAFAPGMKKVKDRRKAHQGEYRTVEDKRMPAGIWYWLVRRIQQAADPRALPSSGLLADAVLAAMLQYLNTTPGARSQLVEAEA